MTGLDNSAEIIALSKTSLRIILIILVALVLNRLLKSKMRNYEGMEKIGDEIFKNAEFQN